MFKNERHELVFRIHSSIYNEAFLRKWLTAKIFIADIRSGSKYPSDERNKLFSFQIKATLKATTLGIRMCSKKLLLWKNQKGSTRYPMILCKRDYTADIFLGIFKIFWTNYLTKQLQTTDCKGGFFCLEHQMIIVFVELRKGNFLNVIGEILFWEQF